MRPKELESTLRFEIKIREDRWEELKKHLEQLNKSSDYPDVYVYDRLLRKMKELEEE